MASHIKPPRMRIGRKIKKDQVICERIVSMTTSDGQQFLADKDYSVASVNTRFQDNPLFGARNVVDTGKVFADELIKYIRVNSPLRPMLDGRITS